MRVLGSKEEAEDLTQEVFVQVFPAASYTLRGESKLGTWLYRIAVNLAKNRTMYSGRDDTSAPRWTSSMPRRPTRTSALQGVTTGETRRPGPRLAWESSRKGRTRVLARTRWRASRSSVLRDVECLSYEEVGVITGLCRAR